MEESEAFVVMTMHPHDEPGVWFGIRRVALYPQAFGIIGVLIPEPLRYEGIEFS